MKLKRRIFYEIHINGVYESMITVIIYAQIHLAISECFWML